MAEILFSLHVCLSVCVHWLFNANSSKLEYYSVRVLQSVLSTGGWSQIRHGRASLLPICLRLSVIHSCRMLSGPDTATVRPQCTGAVAQWGMKLTPPSVIFCHLSDQHQYFYELCDVVLRSVESETYLGVTVSSNLSWSLQITAICMKTNKNLGFFKRKLKGTPQELKHLAYIAFVRSGMDMLASSGILSSLKTVTHWKEFREGLPSGSQISMVGLQLLLRYFISSISNPVKKCIRSSSLTFCIKF